MLCMYELGTANYLHIIIIPNYKWKGAINSYVDQSFNS